MGGYLYNHGKRRSWFAQGGSGGHKDKRVCIQDIFKERLLGFALLSGSGRVKKREISTWKLGEWMMVPFPKRGKCKKKSFLG